LTHIYDTIIIGAGLNGLTTAAYLAKSGHRVLLLERRPIIGGAAATEEFPEAPGFKFDTVTHNVAGVDLRIVRELGLTRHSLEFVDTELRVFAPLPDGGGLVLARDQAKTVESIRRFSKVDADKWTNFTHYIARMAEFIAEIHSATPPRLTEISPENLWMLGSLGLELRSLGKKETFEFLRMMPMPVAEFLDDWFESDVLKGTLGAAGIHGMMLGPRGGGTTYNFLRQCRKGIRPTQFVRGGMGNLARALADAAKARGAETRSSAEVAQILVREGRAVGVLLVSGEEIYGRQIASSADPRRTFLGFIDPRHLNPTFIGRVRNIRFHGAVAQVHLALGELPKFEGANIADLRGTISISPSLDYLERAYDDAKYGDISRQPYLEVVIPSLTDPSRAPEGQHVLSVWVQYAPYYLRGGTWDQKHEDLGNLVVETLAQYAPNIKSAIEFRRVLTPYDLEAMYGLSEGNLNQGEVTLDQFFFMRPVPGCAQYRTPIQNLYLCGAGAHPGGIPCAAGYNAAQEMIKGKWPN
jgi:phytoene dehydrogenase-like protein